MRKVFLFFLACLYWVHLYSTHNRAGEITYIQTGPLSITMTITTYTKASSTAADRDSLEVFWGDGTSQFVKRTNGIGDILQNDVKRNYYTAEHLYPGRGTYTISFLDPNRVGGIINLNFPRSEEVQFYLSTTFTLLDMQFQGENNSAILLQPPIDVACVGEIYTHNPNAYDPDGDSLSYELIVPLSAKDTPVPNYFFPDQIIPSSFNKITIDPKTGDFIWNSPPQAGEYNIAFKINEYRNGILINTIIRDMQILVRVCNNEPPKIEVEEEICVVAGTKIVLPINVTDANSNQKVLLTALGGPMNLSVDAAILNVNSGFNPTPFNATFEWQTTCNHIAKEYYQVVFRALDNAFGDTFGLATLKTLRIKVVGPEPIVTQAITMGIDQVRIEWQLPYKCENTLDDYFYGFSVWRKEGSKEIMVDTCNLQSINGIYRRISFNTTQNDGNVYYFTDSGLNANTTYCYRVIAQFAKKSATGNPYNRVESIPSDELCLQLRRDIPLFTKISVKTTDVNNGTMDIKWTKPLIKDFDTLTFTPPYKTELYRREFNKGNFVLINNSTKTSNTFSSWTDTIFEDTNINTSAMHHEYQLKFYYNANVEYKELLKSSSLFLQVNPGDRKNILTVSSNTSWTNKKYKIYRKQGTSNFSLIATVTDDSFTDFNLNNNETYCYIVESEGSYNIKNIEDPLYNFSQEVCSTPNDNEPPCNQELEIVTICDNENISQDELYNELNWKKNTSCTKEEIPLRYNIYYKSTVASDFELVLSTDKTTIQHLPGENNISGCYIITALDFNGNESEPSNEVCVENCPIYDLPNTFTPNGDGDNELFKPIKNFFIASVNFELFNEWGVKVFETTDPAINWNGKTKSGNDVAEGTYYYVCNVFVSTIDGTSNFKKLKGYINIIR